MRLIQLTVVAAIAATGAYTLFIGVRDGLLRRRIISRLHRDGREFRGAPALLHGVATAAAGAIIGAFAVWIGLEILREHL